MNSYCFYPWFYLLLHYRNNDEIYLSIDHNKERKNYIYTFIKVNKDVILKNSQHKNFIEFRIFTSKYKTICSWSDILFLRKIIKTTVYSFLS